MKKILMAIAAAVMMSSNMLAQDEKTEVGKEQRKVDMTEMVQKRTDETVKRYGLSEEQAAQLLKLNTKYAGKMGPGRRGPRPEGRKGREAQGMKQQGQMPDVQKNDTLAKKDSRQMMRPNREQMRKEMEEYDAEIKKIMTDEQYQKYKADRQSRMKERPQGQRREKHEN